MVKKSALYSVVLGAWLFTSNCRPEEPGKRSPARLSILSFSQNPANNWQVGYTLTDTLDPYQVQLCTFADTARTIPLWRPANNPGGYYPYAGQNKDSVSRLDVSQRWAVKPYQIAMEGSNTGQFSILQFTGPASGSYRIKVVFEGVHFGLSTTDVHVLLNATLLFRDTIEGYGGDPGFHEITGAHPAATYEAVIDMNKGDLLTFAVGYGANKTHFNDTTGLLILIEPV